MASWDLLVDGDGPGALQMATDEAMLDIVQMTGRPLLRLYRFFPRTLSLGRGQSLEEVYLPGVKEVRADLVRRPSGGKAVLHDDEVTYAFASPDDLFPKNVTESYRVIAGGLLLGLRRLGIEAALSDGEGGPEELAANCFIHPSFYELTVRGKKSVGSAQVRHRGSLLQHGSVPLTLDYPRWSVCFAAPGAARDRFREAMTRRSTGLFQDRDTRPSYAEVGDALVAGMGEHFGISFRSFDGVAPLRALAREKLDVSPATGM